MNPEPPAISTTESLCPECLGRIPAQYIRRENDVYLSKVCPTHGRFESVVWRGAPAYESWEKPKIPAYPEKPFTTFERGCPYDCGLCPEHRQQPCCVLLEVTQRCDLVCPVCFASAGCPSQPDPDMETILGWLDKLLAAGGPFNIQLSGGEPCLRDDLPEMIAYGRLLGYSFFQLNTNGLRLASDPEYVAQLKEAGLSTVYLQFDGTYDAIYEKIRGRPLLDQKLAAIEHCAEQQIGVVLVPTIIPGINDEDIGCMIRFGLKHQPAVRGVHFQPVSYFGRYPRAPRDQDRITLPEIIRLVEEKTQGLMPAGSFKPSGGENAHCSFHGNFVAMPDGKLIPLTRHEPDACCCKPADAKQGRLQAQTFVSRAWAAPPLPEQRKDDGSSLGEWDVFLERSRTHLFCISGMAFQDAWTVDLDRLRDCYILTVSPDGRLIPFCAYNLTARDGRSLYRGHGC